MKKRGAGVVIVFAGPAIRAGESKLITATSATGGGKQSCMAIPKVQEVALH